MGQDKRWRHLKAGEVLFREGDAADSAYVIETGHLEVFRGRDAGRTVLATLGAGDVVGEMAMVDHKARTASVAATSATRLLVLSREHLQGKLAGTDPLVRLLLQVVLQRYRHVVVGDKPEMADSEADRRQAVAALHLANELEAAHAAGEFVLYFQPIVDLDTLGVDGYEALIRWNRPGHGLVAPGSFMPALEGSGLMVDVGRWVMQEACTVLARIQREHRPAKPLYVSVNLSARQLPSASLLEDIASAVEGAGLTPQQLKLELTESAFVANMEVAASVIKRCREIGCTVSVDDFGTGYSSLNYLSRFAISAVKIDRTFVTAMLNSPESVKVLVAIRDLARALNLDIVAEGVEDVEQALSLRQMEIGAAQGYLFSKPVGEAAAGKLLDQEWPWMFERRRVTRRSAERRGGRGKGTS